MIRLLDGLRKGALFYFFWGVDSAFSKSIWGMGKVFFFFFGLGVGWEGKSVTSPRYWPAFFCFFFFLVGGGG